MQSAHLPATLVVGLGKSGVSAVRWLASRGVRVRATDSREMPPGRAAVEVLVNPSDLFLGSFAAEALEGVGLVVLSPGLPRTLPLLKEAEARGIPVVGDVELFAREAAATGVPVVGITGTNGKSTVTTLVGEMAREAGAGQVIDPKAEGALKSLVKSTGGGVAAAIDFVGAGASFNFGFGALRKAGKMVCVGLMGGAPPIVPAMVSMKAVSVTGSYVGSLQEMQELMAIARSGVLPELPLTTQALETATQALDDLRAGRIRGRTILKA